MTQSLSQIRALLARYSRANGAGSIKVANTLVPDIIELLIDYVDEATGKKAAAESDLSVLDAEEAGARDALTGAFEELKKFEHVAETTRLNQLIALAKRETATFDELGLRKRAV